MAEQDRGIDYYRQFFVDPQKPVDPLFLASSTYLEKTLLGKPCAEGERPTPLGEGIYSDFVQKLARRMEGARCFDEKSVAQLHPNGLMPAILAHEASTLRNNNTVYQHVSPVETAMEDEAVRWMIENIARFTTKDPDGIITFGGTDANLTALTIARDLLVLEKRWDGRSTAAVITSEMAHYSIEKSTEILGPNELIKIVNVPLEETSHKMNIDALRAKIRRCKEKGMPIMAIVALAGQTETGAVDDLAKIAEIARDEEIFLHVDGAYGAPFILSRQAQLFTGMEEAESLTIDPHKYLYVPYNAGSVLFRSAEYLDIIRMYNKKGERYLHRGQDVKREVHRGDKKIAGSMGGQGAAATWAAIQILGVEGLKAVLDHNLDLTKHAYEQLIDKDGPLAAVFEPAYAPELNTLSFYPRAHHKDDWLEQTTNMLEDSTGIYVTTDKLRFTQQQKREQNGHHKKHKKEAQVVFRLVMTHPYTTEETVNKVFSDLLESWQKVVRDNLPPDDERTVFQRI